MKRGRQYNRAVGLEYRAKDEQAPTVSIKGDAVSADQVVRIARRFGVPVVEEPELARALSLLQEEEEIPEELFEAVAIILHRLRTAST
ncbi:MAG: EscU/YscU/HrcU family type III secretion system export apparatus switch protein [Bdellovibrionales bacterium]|nr:EscU/YscU/HrcU family type III secretion system export apparatus switch protein [Bdellovibrionales bacterium]